MSELSGRQDFEEKLAKRAWQDDDFRASLLSDPSTAVRSQLGFDLPADVDIKVIEEPANAFYVVLPAPVKAGKELSDRELDVAAGGSGGAFDTWFGNSCSIPAFYCC